MKVVAYKKPYPITHPNVFTDVELAQPIAKDRDLLIAVHAISINPVDIKVRLRTPQSNNDWKIFAIKITFIDNYTEYIPSNIWNV